uniref:hypothetical protein n=1 Tax=Serratia marcescens TaxID=615 RepID=UPI001C377A61
QIQLLIQLLSHFLRKHNDSFYFAGHEFNFRALCTAAVKIKTPYLHSNHINYKNHIYQQIIISPPHLELT